MSIDKANNARPGTLAGRVARDERQKAFRRSAAPAPADMRKPEDGEALARSPEAFRVRDPNTGTLHYFIREEQAQAFADLWDCGYDGLYLRAAARALLSGQQDTGT